ncbi:malate synthase G [Ketogulonicigenium vulgare]|uniref:Malate synthase G n=1 Tax=Ketogulonicigenium vulgare (strain WSH-001) TaxID=759362 RepID=F9Y7B5_KETVW|nr:malate synthase G [Ketogulonicigenium vulgare]ADO42856.1 malate synthase G [Ketogulonicigenium vulgare Y25]AEM41043.1 Malate synthase G [Ketogulonicigenium vulgare WSH-001]ALJ81190.1 malate synthase G [Ketogulonicigenium vulgare]ANW33933.1 malate synthase G [Ketogulonicigenium vulgare]AOZ54769.1 malate synthase G [Ketogulonicigenium vulgare]
MMQSYVTRAEISVADQLAQFIEDDVLPGTGVTPEGFWAGLSVLVNDYGAENAALLEARAHLQSQIDDWHIAYRGKPHDADAYQDFLREIGYIVPEGPDFTIETPQTDPEFATLAGPQLVVPITNARFALNAVNARWGSLYDALYGTDALGDLPPAGGVDAARAAKVIGWVRSHLDKVLPLAGGSWHQAGALAVTDGAFGAGGLPLRDPAQFTGYSGGTFLFNSNGLGIEIQVNPEDQNAMDDPSAIADVRVEAALTAIMDCEDSVATVDAADKVLAYRNWLGLMRGDLSETFEKGGRKITRRISADRILNAPDGQPLTVRQRSLMLVRNVGHLTTNPFVRDKNGADAFEGLVDAAVTVLIAKHDLARGTAQNSVTGSVYVVKPKMHGPAEVAFATRVFDYVEDMLALPRETVKLGIMDEERRTSVNLKECIRAAKRRVAFINTGFLDRTGDEIHTSMEAGPMLPKGEMKSQPWIQSYEMRNVDIGLACGLRGRAQIGKGMWAMPDRMGEMLAQKIGHPQAGANCAWVPSPTAAVLHALHYHLVDVAARQAEIAAGGPRGTLTDLLTIPTAVGRNFTPTDIARELDNNAQGILGYVVRWIDQGIGCSKVPDIHDVGLMEDRATCRISAQALANWLHHGVLTQDQVMEAFRRMAAVVDRQNAGDADYVPMAPDFGGLAFQAACDLVFLGRELPAGYTEPVLHRRRLQRKTQL